MFRSTSSLVFNSPRRPAELDSDEGRQGFSYTNKVNSKLNVIVKRKHFAEDFSVTNDLQILLRTVAPIEDLNFFANLRTTE